MKRREIERTKSYGRIYSVAGGAPNQATIGAVADVFFAKNDEGWGSWLEPQVISIKRAYFAATDHASVADWIAADRAEWLAEVEGRKRLPVAVMADVSQTPAAGVLMEHLRDAQTAVRSILLTAGLENPMRARTQPQIPTTPSCGAKWLISHFDGRVGKRLTTEQRHGRPYIPGRVVMSFEDFRDETPHGISASELRSAMAAAETLIKRKQTNKSEASMSLSADEAAAACVMLLLVNAEMQSPGTGYSGEQSFGQWDSDEQPRSNFGYLG